MHLKWTFILIYEKSHKPVPVEQFKLEWPQGTRTLFSLGR